MKSWKSVAGCIFIISLTLLAGCGKTADVSASVSMEDAENALQRGYRAAFQWMNNKIQAEVEEQANISDADYQKYQELKNDNELNADGSYIGVDEQRKIDADVKADEEKKAKHKQVHVTFGTNSFIQVKYYSDAYNVSPIDTDSCYMDPGETIYATVPVVNNPNSNQYIFSEYRVYEYPANGGDRELLKTSHGEEVFTIPKNFTGTDISIEPIGEYKRRALNFRAYYIDANGNEQDYSGGNWSVNGEAIEGKNAASIDPSDSYEVTYSFPSDSFYCESTNPESQDINNETGKVVFHKYKALDANSMFEVKLKTYSTLNIHGEVKEITGIEITRKEGTKETFNADDLSDGSKDILVKKGDVVTIATKDGYQSYCDQYDTGTSTNNNNGNYTYTLAIPDNEYSTINIRVGKSELNILLDKNVGKSVGFSVTGSGFKETGLHFHNSGIFNLATETNVLDKTIGLEKTITVSASGGDINNSSAYKVIAEKKAANGVTSRKIYYIDAKSGKTDIEIYGDEELVDSSKVYTNITLTISKVNVVKYLEEKISNGTIEAMLTDDTEGTILQDGNIVEASRNVKVTIKPTPGFYISGDGAKNGTYTLETTVSKYLAKRQSIAKAHPAEQMLDVTLDDTWDYGTCIYRIDGKETEPGQYSLRPDQTLTMECTLKTSGYSIERTSNWPGFLADVQKTIESQIEGNVETVTIPVSMDLNGQTIKPSDFISVVKG